MLDGVRPCDIDAETMVLSDMLLSGSSFLIARRILGDDPLVFYNQFHQHIYRAMLDVVDSGQELEYARVLKRLNPEQTHKTSEEHSAFLLEHLANALDVPAVVKQSASSVRSAANHRNLIQNLGQILDRSMAVDIDVDDTYDQLQALLGARQGVVSAKVYDATEMRIMYEDHIKNIETRRIKFGWCDVDRATRGIIPGEVCAILARASVGKSALAQSLQLSVWERQKIKSIFFSFEMTLPALYERVASMASGWREEEVEDIVKRGDIEILEKLDGHLEGMYYVDKAGLTLDDISAISQSVDGIGMVLIDYLGLIKAMGKDYERTSEIARGLKTLAKETNTAVICIVQVSRKGGDGTVPVTMDMGRDSGVIEEGTDIILGLHRDEKVEGLLHLAVLKARRGRAGARMQMNFKSGTPRVVLLDEREARDELR